MPITVIRPPRAELQRCIARAGDIRPTDDGFPDSSMPGCHRWLYNYLGFQAPAEAGKESPVGNTAAPFIQHVRAGFGVAFVKASPGNGVPFHVHDTNETFMCLEGRFRVEWEDAEGVGHAELGRYDLISIPPHVQRRFVALAVDPGQELAVLLGVLAGDAPGAEYSPEAATWLREAGKLPPVANASEVAEAA